MIAMKNLSAFIMVTDPLHIGTGGYRLGRVDNSIVREPGTNLPKLPATSLSGAARAYAATRYESTTCAGQGSKENPHCGLPQCPICYTFGSLVGETAYKGTVSIFDARLVFFPVSSLIGPLWVTSPDLLREAGFALNSLLEPEKNQALLSWDFQGPLNFGWLMLNGKPLGEGTFPAFPHINPPPEWDWLKNRLAILHERLLEIVVNSNLEVRTSVSIDPFTGAAKTGALFTYEALPRWTVLHFNVVQDDYRKANDSTPDWPVKKTRGGTPLGEEWNSPLDVVKGGLRLAHWLGVGGMSTRGFGRFRLISQHESNPLAEKEVL